MRIDSIVKLTGAYYADENLVNNEYNSSWSLKIRIPADKFESFIGMIESGTDEVLYKNIEASDVTEEYVDLETRLANKRHYLKRYNDLLQKASTIEDILKIEEKTRVIEEEIESAEGRLRFLANRVAMSTLNLIITKNKAFTFKPSRAIYFFERLKQSVSKGWFGLLDFLLFIIKLWPLILILTGAYYLYRKIRRNKHKKSS